ncbi:MAG: hypothetical protein AUK03_09690 [Anaerolineae bacterium CG2_30_64_16]|nr:MAG: hypothetical protein AUK03_09690 [Anaerolineae bacterium CG2_30_64_16]
MPEPPPTEPGPELDLNAYEGRWVALVRGQVAGVGRTADAALRAARRTRPREEATVVWVRRAPPPPG